MNIFVLIIWVWLKKNYPNTTITSKIPRSTMFLGWIISCHWFIKYSILTIILTFRNTLFPNYLSKGNFIFEIEVGGVDNIPIIAKKINATHLHGEESLLTRKSSTLSIFNTLNKTIISRYLYENYVSNYDDKRHFKSYNLDFG